MKVVNIRTRDWQSGVSQLSVVLATTKLAKLGFEKPASELVQLVAELYEARSACAEALVYIGERERVDDATFKKVEELIGLFALHQGEV